MTWLYYGRCFAIGYDRRDDVHRGFLNREHPKRTLEVKHLEDHARDCWAGDAAVDRGHWPLSSSADSAKAETSPDSDSGLFNYRRQEVLALMSGFARFMRRLGATSLQRSSVSVRE
jgi:hypothetical protein